MTIVHAASIINIPLCIWGAPGAGKTAMIRAFGRIRAEMLGIYSKYAPSFQMHTFHNGTKANDFFGTTTIKEGGEITFSNGTLTTAMKDGYIFIADEMNVSPIQTMKSLAPTLNKPLENVLMKIFKKILKIIKKLLKKIKFYF